MRIIISPAKKMNVEDSLPWRGLPVFLEKTEELKTYMQGLSYEEAKGLWKCSDQIASLNMERLSRMDLRRNPTPAILSYEGIQYQYMAPKVMDEDALSYLQEHLRILSGFYGVLKPFDGIVPYRLEMQAKAKAGGKRDLYDFWGSSLYQEVACADHRILNLASREYSQCIEKYRKPEDVFVTCVFGEIKGEKVVQKATMAKMARGEMVRFLAETRAEGLEDARGFDRLGFCFSRERSTENQYVFLKEET